MLSKDALCCLPTSPPVEISTDVEPSRKSPPIHDTLPPELESSIRVPTKVNPINPPAKVQASLIVTEVFVCCNSKPGTSNTSSIALPVLAPTTPPEYLAFNWPSAELFTICVL